MVLHKLQTLKPKCITNKWDTIDEWLGTDNVIPINHR